MKKIVQVLLFTFAFSLYSTPIIINDPSDYHILDQFFRKMINEEVFGYVLEGNKPLSALNIPSKNRLAYPHSRFFQWDILARVAIKKWNQLAPEQKGYVFKAADVLNHSLGEARHELLFINRKKMKETLDANLDLFRILLGPTIESSSLANFIADSPRSLDSIIKSNNTLMGILLGYGTYNSLMGGRWEEINGVNRNLDLPPFSGYNFSQKAREHPSWDLQNYFLSCVGAGIRTMTEKLFTEPGLGFPSLREEEKQIQLQEEAVPTPLLKEKPVFIFGAYKNGSNKELFEKAQSSQKRIQSLLSKPDLLEYVLEKITEEKPVVNCSPSQNIRLVVNGNAEEAVSEALWEMVQELDEETIPAFMQAFSQCNPADNKRAKLRIAPRVLSGLKLARSNLEVAEAQFLTWSKTKDVEEVVPQGLYFENIKSGNGKYIDSSTDVLISYVIEDGLGNVLSAQHNCWMDLSQTIPAFAHGMQGMQEGETRKIYIHPKYGYGALTTLSPCVSLIAKVTLHGANDQITGNLPSLLPIDLNWVNDSKFFEEVKEISYQDATYLGHLWGVWLKKSSDLNFSQLCDRLKQLSENPVCRALTKDKQQLCDHVFWNLIVAAPSS